MTVIASPAAGNRNASGRDYISFSAINTFQTCSLRYYFRYVLGLSEDTISASLVMGSAIHACLQFHFEQLLAGSESPSLDVLLDVFHDSWQTHAGQQVIFGKGEDINTVSRLAERMLRAFQTSALARPSGTIIAVEEELRGQLIPGVPDLLARVDLVIDEGDALSVTDFKTARTIWSQDHVEESAEQLLLYHELAKELSDGRPVKLGFAVLSKTKVPDVAIYPVEASAQRLERTKKVVERAWKVIKSGVFLPSPSPLHCPACPFRAPCSQGKW
jgi:CRISPR/Cas system-associated exonuclease Cas4 (RecB family)